MGHKRQAAALGLLLAALAGGACAGPLQPRPAVNADLGAVWIRPADGMAMVRVPAGEFVMGSDRAGVDYAVALCRRFGTDAATALATCQRSAFADEQPAHTVTLDVFWLDRTEVTNGQYRLCEASGRCTPPENEGSYSRALYHREPGFAGYPVVWVTWQQAAEYCRWAGARLPSEAEWEYAARGTEGRLYPWGDEFDGVRLNYCDARRDAGPNDGSVDDGYADTAPVGSYPAGASWAGALDLAGNVREWVADWYGRYPAEPQDSPTGPANGDARIPRGGSWLDKPDDVRSANRGANDPDYTRHKVGFRCAWSPEGSR